MKTKLNLIELLVNHTNDSENNWLSRVKKWVKSNNIENYSENNIILLTPKHCLEYAINSNSLDKVQLSSIVLDIHLTSIQELQNKVDILENKDSKFDNEFKKIFEFENWSFTINEIVNEFIECNSNDDILEIVFKWTYAITYFNKYTTQRSNITKIRKAIVDSKIDIQYKELILKHLKLPNFISKSIDNNINMENVSRAKNINIEKIKIQDIKSLINSVENEVKQYIKNYELDKRYRLGVRNKRGYNKDTNIEVSKQLGLTNLMLYITLTTGRRPIEILKLSEFNKINESVISVNNLAKKRGDIESIEIPILFSDSDTVLKAIEFIRLNFDSATLKTSDTKITNKLYVYTNKHWDEIAPTFLQVDRDKFKKCRALYVLSLEVLINQTFEDIRISQAGFLSKLLGHSEDDITTQNSYYKATILIDNFNKKRYLDSHPNLVLFFSKKS